MTLQIGITLVLLALVVIFLVQGKTPLSVVGLGVCVVLLATKVLEPSVVLGQFANPTMFLIAEIFVISGAMIKVGVADIIGDKVKKMVGDGNSGEVKVLLIVGVVTTLMCAFLPRIAVAATLTPVMISIARSTKISRTRLLFVMAMMCSIGGSITLIATPPNLIGKAALEEAALGTIGFFDFAPVGIPQAVIGMALILLLRKTKFIPNRYDENNPEDDDVAVVAPVAGTVKEGQEKWKQKLTLVGFLLLVLAIIFEKQVGIPSFVVGLAVIVVLLVTKVTDEKFAFNKSMNWAMMFFVAGMLALGNAMSASGAGKLIADRTISLLGDTPNPLFLLAVFFLLGFGLTQAMNNTAAAGMLIPIGLTLAAGMGLDPKAVVLAIVIGCNSSFMTPMATPANAMVMEPGKIKFMDYVKLGLPMGIITFILVMIIFPAVFPF